MPFPTILANPGSGSSAVTVNTLPNSGQTTLSNSLPVAIASDQYAYTLTQTLINLTANNSVLLIAANPNRKYLEWMVVGARDVTVIPGTGVALVGQGMIYTATAGGSAGAGEIFQYGCPTNAFSCISAGASTIIVWEGA